MRRCEEEFYATVWAINIMRDYGILGELTDREKSRYQRYIHMELDRGLRRGGVGYPSREALTLNWDC
jgi:hypothetical protein